jgi:hypothetical protein
VWVVWRVEWRAVRRLGWGEVGDIIGECGFDGDDFLGEEDSESGDVGEKESILRGERGCWSGMYLERQAYVPGGVKEGMGTYLRPDPSDSRMATASCMTVSHADPADIKSCSA